MLQYIEILIIAAAQGIGEFLPISSSGHNAVINHLFNRFGVPLTGSESDFIKLNVLLHAGTLAAVVLVFWRRILAMFGKDFRLIPLIILATIPGAAVGLVIKKSAPWIEESLWIIAPCFLITAFLLLWTLTFSKGEKTAAKMTYLDALLIGIVQGIAVLPGISRSGSTIVAGLVRKLDREEAAAFSFLMSIPIIAGSTILEAKDLFGISADAAQHTAAEFALKPELLLLGVAVSFVVGIVSLIWLLNWLKQGKLWYFAVWLLLMVPLTFVLAFTDNNNDETTEIRGLTPPAQETVAVSENSVRENSEPENSLTKAIEKTTSDRLNMSREEAQKEYEKIVAEEEAKEKAAIEEEKKRLPFVDEPEKLILVSAEDQIWITPDKKSVIALGRIALREGLLELFACRTGTKEHESIVSMRVKPYMLHAALLAAGADSGKPVQVTPKFVPPSGDEIEIRIRWKDENGGLKEVLARDLVLDEDATKESGKQTAMKSNWVFSGSMMYKDDEGKNHYVADETGELFGLSNFVGAILDVPFESSADNADLLFTCFTERIPELHTPVTLILTPVKPAPDSGANTRR
jgi:undecaprenyl-diphosphatase